MVIASKKQNTRQVKHGIALLWLEIYRSGSRRTWSYCPDLQQPCEPKAPTSAVLHVHRLNVLQERALSHVLNETFGGYTDEKKVSRALSILLVRLLLCLTFNAQSRCYTVSCLSESPRRSRYLYLLMTCTTCGQCPSVNCD